MEWWMLIFFFDMLIWSAWMSVSTVHGPLYTFYAPLVMSWHRHWLQVFSETVIHGIESQHSFNLTEFSWQSFCKISYTCSSDYSVYEGECSYTHVLHAQFSAHSAWTVTFAHVHACALTRMAQDHEKNVCCMFVISLHRLLPSHVSPVFACPWRSLRDHSWLWRPHVLVVLTCPQSAEHAHLRTSSEKFGFLAKSDANTVLWNSVEGGRSELLQGTSCCVNYCFVDAWTRYDRPWSRHVVWMLG